MAARYNLVEIAEACREGSEVFIFDGRNPASDQPVDAADAVAQLTNLVISVTVDLGICKRHNLVEIAEACRREADVGTSRRDTSVEI